MRRWRSSILVVLAISAAVRAGQDPPAEPALTPHQKMLEAFNRGEFEQAERQARAIISDDPGDWRTRYNLGVILARRGEVDASVEVLIDAISFGFVDLHEMDRDANLASVRESPKYQRIIERWGVLLNAVADSRFKDISQRLGAGYRPARDSAHRLLWLSAIDGESFADAQREAARVDAWCRSQGLFPDADPARPDPWVTVIIPTGQDFPSLVPFAMVGGTYSRDEKRLVTRDIGPTLRHEFFHVLHWRHMDRLGQVHPIWVQEGMASLLEDVELASPDGNAAGGTYIIRPSWRTNIAKRMARSTAMRSLDEFLALPRDRFVTVRPSANYAEARALMMFLHDRAVLGAFYKALVAGLEHDPTGAAALEIALGEPMREIDRDFRLWLAELPEVGEQAHPPDAVLGVGVGPGSGDGPVVAGGPDLRGRSALLGGDVIVAIEGRAVATLDDLYRVLGDFEPGDEVSATVKRAGARREVRVTLRAREHPGPF